MSVTALKTVLVAGALYRAGDEVPDEAAGKITAAGVFASRVVKTSEAEGYDGLKVDDLKAEIDRRNEGRDEADLLSAEGKKADLVATLQGDDASKG